MATNINDVTVTITLDSKGQPQFAMSGKNVAGEMITFDSGDWTVNFDLDDRTGRGYVFPSSLDDALWVEKITGKNHCPKKANKWSEFAAQRVSNGNKSLEVTNLNSYLQYFGFVLNVTLDPVNGPLVPYDPIGNNQNASSQA